MKRNYLFRTALIALTSITVFIDLAYIFFSLREGFTGFVLDSDMLVYAFVWYGCVFWPLLLGCLIFNICAITYLIKSRKCYDKAEYMQYLRMLGRKMKTPVLILLAAAVGIAIVMLAEAYWGEL